MPRESTPDPHLAAALLELREGQQRSQESVAYEAKLSVTAYRRIERGQVDARWGTLRRIAAVFELSMTELARTADALRG
jgi:transcriptional regulator with XRE-family HTH domain